VTEMPFRWDLVRPDQLGALLNDVPAPDLWFLDELVAVSGKVLARSGGGDLVFVGRSLDSMYDLLSGALAGASVVPGRLPFGWMDLWARRRTEARCVLAELGLAPADLARRRRPVTFVDVVSTGGTLGFLFGLLQEWVADDRAQWDVVRRTLRFVGVTARQPTSPKAWRWKEDADWPRELPGRAVVNVSVTWPLWSYLADGQTKLHPSFVPDGGGTPPRHDDPARRALAEAVALVAYGRSREGRRAIARATAGEPALAQPWLRSLVTHLNR
jgi:hypothetical protein